MSGNISRMNKQQDSRVHWALNVLRNIVFHPRNDLDEHFIEEKNHENVFLLLQLVKKG